MLEQSEELYRQELNRLRLANLAELRNLQGKRRMNPIHDRNHSK
jgi:hypothetical protein